jgi:predicted  nucleic acid-binding Zn-ribbon protein
MVERKEQIPMGERLSALERELVRLRREHADAVRQLADANNRLRELEAARDLALDRIDWAIDSLHNVIDQRQ